VWVTDEWFVTSHPKFGPQKLLNVAVRPLGGSASGDGVAAAGSLDVAVAVGDAEAGGDAGDLDAGAAGVEDTAVLGVDGLLLGPAEAEPIPASQNAVATPTNATLRPARISPSNR
jgi:hypothetical protein